MYSYKEDFNSLRLIFENELEIFLKDLKVKPAILKESMVYSLLAGGKRLRPVILIKLGQLLEVNQTVLYPFAIALECIHTYSLIHDDLPAMDNDDYRRGKLTNHKKFGEDNAILSGDGLLNLAFEICLNECLKGIDCVQASKYLANCSGVNGMIAGQSADLLFSNKKSFTMKDLEFIQSNKTSKLIMASFGIPCFLAGGRYIDEFEQFAYNLGLLFQITDDILDVEGTFEELGKSIGKDDKDNKLTSVNLLGIEGAKKLAVEYKDKCLKILEQIDIDTAFFEQLVEDIISRKS